MENEGSLPVDLESITDLCFFMVPYIHFVIKDFTKGLIPLIVSMMSLSVFIQMYHTLSTYVMRRELLNSGC